MLYFGVNASIPKPISLAINGGPELFDITTKSIILLINLDQNIQR